MSNFASVEADIIVQKIDETSATKNHSLGKIIRAVDKASTDYGTGEFIYLKGVASTAVGSWVLYSPDDLSTSLLAANAIGSVAVAMSANVDNT